MRIITVLGALVAALVCARPAAAQRGVDQVVIRGCLSISEVGLVLTALDPSRQSPEAHIGVKKDQRFSLVGDRDVLDELRRFHVDRAVEVTGRFPPDRREPGPAVMPPPIGLPGNNAPQPSPREPIARGVPVETAAYYRLVVTSFKGLSLPSCQR